MIVDLHCHYPMHLPETYRDAASGNHDSLENFVRGVAMDAVNALFNAPMVVSIDRLRAGGIMVALSVLYQPLDEIDLGKTYGSPPDPQYPHDLDVLIDAVENDIAGRNGADAVVAHNHGELEAASKANQVALIHAVEGGLHFGSTANQVSDSVRSVAARGVAYITPAHLFYRQVATNAPAIPLLSDDLYNFICHQPSTGVQPLGRALIEEMAEQHVIVDLTHMSRRSVDATLKILTDADKTAPVMVTHGACALNSGAEYNTTREQLLAIRDRNGVIGLIACEHWMSWGGDAPANADESFALICRHIDWIRDATGTYENIAIGSDMDGFIRPSLKGLDRPSDYAKLTNRLNGKYPADVVEKICSTNALRVLEYWKGA